MQDLGESWGLLPSKEAVVFVDNHDLQRSDQSSTLTYKSGKLYELALILMLAHPYGIARIMSSYAFDDPNQGPPSVPVHTETQGESQSSSWLSHAHNYDSEIQNLNHQDRMQSRSL